MMNVTFSSTSIKEGFVHCTVSDNSKVCGLKDIYLLPTEVLCFCAAQSSINFSHSAKTVKY